MHFSSACKTVVDKVFRADVSFAGFTVGHFVLSVRSFCVTTPSSLRESELRARSQGTEKQKLIDEHLIGHN